MAHPFPLTLSLLTSFFISSSAQALIKSYRMEGCGNSAAVEMELIQKVTSTTELCGKGFTAIHTGVTTCHPNRTKGCSSGGQSCATQFYCVEAKAAATEVFQPQQATAISVAVTPPVLSASQNPVTSVFPKAVATGAAPATRAPAESVSAIIRREGAEARKALDAQTSANPFQKFASQAQVVSNLFNLSPFHLLILLMALLTVSGMWRIFEKAGVPGSFCLIPIYSWYKINQIAGLPGWYFLLDTIPIVGIYFVYRKCVGVSERFGHGTGMALLILFLPFIAIPYLGLSSRECFT